MITYQEAYNLVLANSTSFTREKVALKDACNRILAEDILADRDFPPFNRATKDGIVCNYQSIEEGFSSLKVSGVISAGNPTKNIPDYKSAFEIMTGAVVPDNGDSVIMYEELEFQEGYVVLPSQIKKGQNIHFKGSDLKKNELVIKSPKLIGASEIGILASVGKSEVWVKKLPKVAVISTGNELVEVEEEPEPYQIRKSNTLSLKATLESLKISADTIHLKDDKISIEKAVLQSLDTYDVLLISGGVSKGKFDFLPDAMTSCGVKKVFHRVLQRPGKPFWFGKHTNSNTTIFSFPGNPVSTFANYHIYFIPWLKKSYGLSINENNVILAEKINAHSTLTRYVPVKLRITSGKIFAEQVYQNGSGDLTSLTHTDGFVRLDAKTDGYPKETVVPFISTKFLSNLYDS
ncbi:molybdopterin molybdotransferase MoeA [Ascidiimonas sp. W6]|uniref:molybdopterin molybdotransferase MoeA n=1 Tax=Ascidiimonas meishanensis TaxID=3128903 RepID=UPI0030EB59AC